MIPAANLLGFAGQELARKLPHVLGVILETTFGSISQISNQLFQSFPQH